MKKGQLIRKNKILPTISRNICWFPLQLCTGKTQSYYTSTIKRGFFYTTPTTFCYSRAQCKHSPTTPPSYTGNCPGKTDRNHVTSKDKDCADRQQKKRAVSGRHCGYHELFKPEQTLFMPKNANTKINAAQTFNNIPTRRPC